MNQATDKPRLLIADDDGVVLATLAKGLRDAGYQVDEARSGEEAVALADGRAYDLAILDIRMPGMSGIEVAARLRELRLQTIYLSAYNDYETVESAVGQGTLGYLVKPIDVPRMIPTIEAALRQAEDLRMLAEEKLRMSEVLETTREINVAVGLLMERFRLDRQAAFDGLRRRARSERRKLQAVAEEVIAAAEVLNAAGKPHEAERP